MPGATPVMIAAIHEAGHAVAAYALGNPIRSATLALVWTRPRDARAAVLIALAGPAAEIVHAGIRARTRAAVVDRWATDRRNAMRASRVGGPTSILLCAEPSRWCSNTGIGSSG